MFIVMSRQSFRHVDISRSSDFIQIKFSCLGASIYVAFQIDILHNHRVMLHRHTATAQPALAAIRDPGLDNDGIAYIITLLQQLRLLQGEKTK